MDGVVTDKRELTVADPTGGIKVLLWGNVCETEILTDKTYLFKSFRFRSNNYACYLNTAKDLPCSIEQVADFTKSLAESDPTELREIDAKLSLVLIETSNKYYLCLKCGSKI